MILSFNIDGHDQRFDISEPIDLSIPLNFNGEQPNAYGVERATSKPCEAESLIGDTRRGGSCNFEQYTFIPHCNGTHTEGIGHITHERISVLGSLKDTFMPAALISVEPQSALDTTDTYVPEKKAEDRLITRAALEKALGRSADIPVRMDVARPKNGLPANAGSSDINALIVRTLPNDCSKKTRNYTEDPSPFFSLEAVSFIIESGFKHLLVDTPSIDRMFDEGKLSAHRIFWNVPPGSHEVNSESRVGSTITEMIYVPDEIKDGMYLLNLQVAPFAADAAPSRPLIFEQVC